MDKQPVSAIVISYNGLRFIPDCLSTLKADLGDRPHEIIIVDNHSTDGALEYIERHHPDVILIKNDRNLGFAKAVNQGIDAARHEYLWILNQDIRIRAGCLDALMACAAKLPRPGVIGPTFVGFDGRLQSSCRRFPRYHHLFFELTGLAYLFPRSRLFNGWKMGDFDHTVSAAVEQPMGAAMLISHSAISEIGMMDESFGIFFNDVDFCRRLQEAGYVNYYCVDGVIEHYAGGSISRRKASMVWRSHISMYRYLKKWENRRQGSRPIRLLRAPMPYLAGLLLILTAIPRSIYHYYRSSI